MCGADNQWEAFFFFFFFHLLSPYLPFFLSPARPHASSPTTETHSLQDMYGNGSTRSSTGCGDSRAFECSLKTTPFI